jgi:polyhydroxybutyrate depolymerase
MPTWLATLLLATLTGPGDHDRSLLVNGQKRTYFVHVPASASRTAPLPAVLVFHGAAMNARMMRDFCGMNEKSDREGFLVAYPDGDGVGSLRTWNAGDMLGPLSDGRPDDVAFTRKILDDLESTWNVDRKRIYAAGMSNGGMMCYRLASELGDRIAAFAPISGTLAMKQIHPPRPIPIMHMHGTADPIIPFTGPRLGKPPRVISFYSVAQTMELWANLNNCDPTPTVTEFPDIHQDGTRAIRRAYRPRVGGAEVVLIEIEGGGHTWPGRTPRMAWLGRSTHDIQANDLIWEFFQRHPLP